MTTTDDDAQGRDEQRISEYTEQDRANEGCCWDYPRDHCPGRRCKCVCHEVRADHRMEAYCAPATSCAMVHPCHRAGCTFRPDQHPGWRL